MGDILLLYDTTEKDLARDFKELLAELDLTAKMIPLSPDIGKTLQSKEEHYFNSVEGIVFLITPGSERKGKLFPSPSVADEMGQAKQMFKDKPEKVIYLVDNDCNVQAVDQKGYIPFDRKEIRSVIEAVTSLIKNLKEAELIGRRKIEHRETPGIKIGVGLGGLQDSYEALAGITKDKIKDAIPHLENIGHSVYKTGMDYAGFAKIMKAALGDMWDRFKPKMIRVYQNVKKASLQGGLQPKGLAGISLLKENETLEEENQRLKNATQPPKENTTTIMLSGGLGRQRPTAGIGQIPNYVSERKEDFGIGGPLTQIPVRAGLSGLTDTKKQKVDIKDGGVSKKSIKGIADF